MICQSKTILAEQAIRQTSLAEQATRQTSLAEQATRQTSVSSSAKRGRPTTHRVVDLARLEITHIGANLSSSATFVLPWQNIQH
jgi:hypothetical protein